MPDRGWKQVERRMAKDVGLTRIPVTGERNGADFGDGMFAYQVKVRRMLPSWLWTWLLGIQQKARETNRTGVLVLKLPAKRDENAVVMLSWKDWVALHGKTPLDELDPDEEPF